MKIIDAEVIFRPDRDHLGYLPEGPYRLRDGRVSWVGIQHGANSTHGSLNFFDPSTGENTSVALQGRPGFAFPSNQPDMFVIGMERSVVLFDVKHGSTEVLANDIDEHVEGTIINDGVVFGDHLLFGCKELSFKIKKAGLYLLDNNRELTRLADDQICSNGKAIRNNDDGTLTLFDICSCSKQVTAWNLDLEEKAISNRQTVVDLTSEPVFPDGMILTPDEQSLIVAIFNPGDADCGEARQYSISSGEIEAIWRCDASSRVTCPQLIEHDGQIRLLLTTADEGMAPPLRRKNSNAGCLFIADTDFNSLNDNPPFVL